MLCRNRIKSISFQGINLLLQNIFGRLLNWKAPTRMSRSTLGIRTLRLNRGATSQGVIVTYMDRHTWGLNEIVIYGLPKNWIETVGWDWKTEAVSQCANVFVSSMIWALDQHVFECCRPRGCMQMLLRISSRGHIGELCLTSSNNGVYYGNTLVTWFLSTSSLSLAEKSLLVWMKYLWFDHRYWLLSAARCWRWERMGERVIDNFFIFYFRFFVGEEALRTTTN